MKIEDIEKALAGFPAETPPRSLYRFSGEAGFGSISDGTLKLTEPGQFNDPFEMWAGVSESDITEENMLKSVLAKDGLFRLSVKLHGPPELQDEKTYDRFYERVVRTKKELWPDHLRLFAKVISGVAKTELGVTCFSEFEESHLLGVVGIHHWGVYADRHRGIAIEYDGESEFFRRWAAYKLFFKIQYLANRHLVRISEFDTWDDHKMWRILREWSAIKCSESWDREREWRLVLPSRAGIAKGNFHHTVDKEGVNHHFMRMWEATTGGKLWATPKIVRRIYLGANTSDGFESRVKLTLSQPHLQHIELCKLEPCHENYALVSKVIKK